MSDSDSRFKPKSYSKSDDQEDDGNQLVRELLKADEPYVKLCVGGNDKTVGRDGFVELRNDDHTIGKLEVQMKPVKSRRSKSGIPCFKLPSSLVGHSRFAGLPFILICYDRISRKAYWKLIDESLFLNVGHSQKSVTIFFDPATESIGKGFPYLQHWRQLAQNHLEAMKQWKDLETDFALLDLAPEHVNSYQIFIDTINNGLDGEFYAVKRTLYPTVWKFGVGVFQAKGASSWHRLYKIAKGQNGPLLIKLEKREKPYDYAEELKAAKKTPLGPYSRLFNVSPQSDGFDTRFFNRAESKGKQFLFDSFKKVCKEQKFPLFGELLCLEQLFEFIELFKYALNLKTSDEVDLAGLLLAVEASLSQWITLAAIDMKLQPPFIVDEALFREIAALSESNKYQPDLSRPLTQEDWNLRNSILESQPFQLALSSCRTLLNLGYEVIRNPYRDTGLAPVTISPTVDVDDLKHNLSIIFENVSTEYEKFVLGNGFKTLQSNVLNKQESTIYRIDPAAWLASYQNYGIFGAFDPYSEVVYVENPGNLKRSMVEFVDRPGGLPEPEPTITISGQEVQVLAVHSSSTKKIFSRHPVRDLVYEMLAEDAQRSYDPNYTELRWWY